MPLADHFPGLLGASRRARWRRLILRRALAAVAAGLAVLVTIGALQPARPESATVRVVVAASDLSSGTILTGEQVRLAELPLGTGPPQSYAVSDLVTGRMLAAPIAAGEAVTATRLVPRGPLDGLPAGLAATHVRALDPAVLALVAPGMRVRLHAPTGVVLARNVLVLAVDRAGTEGSSGAQQESAGGLVVALPERVAVTVLGGLVGPNGTAGLQIFVEGA